LRPAGLFLLGDHLQQDVAGDVVARLVLDDPQLLALHDQGADVVEGNVPALRRVVQATVRVLLDQALFAHAPECTSGVLRRKKQSGWAGVAKEGAGPAAPAGPAPGRGPTLRRARQRRGADPHMTQQQVLEQLQARLGQEIHTSDWLEITQARIDAFADATGDR
jgi:hypothetical protein